MKKNSQRVSVSIHKKTTNGPIIYWMSRDQRAEDNWAFLYAQELALEAKQPLVVVFCLVPEFLGATMRQYGFMLKGLEEVESKLKKLHIPFCILLGNPPDELEKFTKKIKAGAVVTDFDPLKIKRTWKETLGKKINCAFYEVDAHNIVPCTFTSNKQEYGAYTIRPKIHKLLPEFLTEFPKIKTQAHKIDFPSSEIHWKKIYSSLKIDSTVEEVDWITPGENAAHLALKDFIKKRLRGYDENRNDPNLHGQSGLSPYLHFGQLSAQRVALEVSKYRSEHRKDVEAFLEELIVRRELSDNFCYYNHKYDSFAGFPAWAQKSLNEHRGDAREFVYTKSEFEKAKTHDELWNASQRQLVKTGKMHGYMRMYWAKKILEWTAAPEEALKIAIYLNDKYELDGRDPNGYVGIAWSLGGVHDRAWFDRSIFGKVRFMNDRGCASKFNVKEYISKFSE